MRIRRVFEDVRKNQHKYKGFRLHFFTNGYGKTEFSIIERETIDGINFYKGLLDNGTVCHVTRENGDYIAYDSDCTVSEIETDFNNRSNCELCIVTDLDETAEFINFASWISEKRKKEQQGN